MQGPSSFWVRPTLRSPPHPLTHPGEGPDHSGGLRGGQTEVQPRLGPSCPRVPVVVGGLPTHCAPSQPLSPAPHQALSTHQKLSPIKFQKADGPFWAMPEGPLSQTSRLSRSSSVPPSCPRATQFRARRARRDDMNHDSRTPPGGAWGQGSHHPPHPGTWQKTTRPHPGRPLPSPRGHGPAGRWLREGRAWVGLQAGPPARSAYR